MIDLFSIGSRSAVEASSMGFTAAHSYCADQASWRAECKSKIRCISSIPGAEYYWLPEEVRYWRDDEMKNFRRLASESLTLHPQSKRLEYQPGHRDDYGMRKYDGIVDDLVVGSYRVFYGYPPQYSIWRPLGRYTVLVTASGNEKTKVPKSTPEQFRFDLWASVIGGAKSFALFRPAVVADDPSLLAVWKGFVADLARYESLIVCGEKTATPNLVAFDPIGFSSAGAPIWTAAMVPVVAKWQLGWRRLMVSINVEAVSVKYEDHIRPKGGDA
jgi:hypothetical protein